MNQLAVLFVFMGNICCSPGTHGVFKAKVMDAGTAHLVKLIQRGLRVTTASARRTKSCVIVAIGHRKVNEHFFRPKLKICSPSTAVFNFLKWRWFDPPVRYPPKVSGIIKKFLLTNRVQPSALKIDRSKQMLARGRI